MTAPTYKDPTQPVAARVRDLLARMTLEEKIAQMHAFWLILDEKGEHRVRPGEAFIASSDDATLQQRLALGVGQITRPLGTHGVPAATGLRALNRLQRFLKDETRLGIPALSHEECLMGLMSREGTLVPSPLALSATWNPTLVEAVGTVIGAECHAVGCQQGLAPVLDVSRDVRWGRTEETFGEDPYLVGLMGVAYVRGLQGPRRDLLATLKHYVGHSFGEGARNHAPVNVGWRMLNDVFLLPFEMAVRLADAGSVMPAYHDIDGEPCHASRHLLTEVLSDKWGFDGLVVADYVGVSLLYQHHGIARDAAEAAALAFNAGLDVELPGDDCAQHLTEALSRGLITRAQIDATVARVLEHKFRLGLFEQRFDDPVEPPALRTSATLETALEAARQSIVVLDDHAGILPLSPDHAQHIALIGPTADDPLALLSGYSYPAHVVVHDQVERTDHIVTLRVGLEAVYGASHISYARGCNILDERRVGAPVFPGDLADGAVLQNSSLSMRTDMIAAAVEAARGAEVAIVCVGDLAGLFQAGTIGEGSDTDSLALPGVQQQLLDAVVATGTPTICVLTSGRPYVLGGLEERLAAHVMAWAGGQQAGTALADVLSGRVPPSGRLTVSVPKSAGAMPYFYNHKLKSAGTPVALHFGALYPFGHGRSLTSFEYRDLELAAATVDIESGDIVLRFDLANIGARTGVEVPQLYVRDRHASVARPVRELKAFARLELAPGEAARVTWRVPVDMLAFTGSQGERLVEPGFFDLMVGASSADIRLRSTVEVSGEPRVLPRNWRMTSSVDLLRL